MASTIESAHVKVLAKESMFVKRNVTVSDIHVKPEALRVGDGLLSNSEDGLETKLESLTSLDRESVEVKHLIRRWIERARLSQREL
jgi:hypothetical protein